MPLVSLKRTKDERNPEETEHDLPVYPWGLNVYLNEDSLSKLGLSVEDFKVGDEFMARAQFRVTSIGQREDQDGMSENVDLVITAFEKPGSYEDEKSRASKLFGGGEDAGEES